MKKIVALLMCAIMTILCGAMTPAMETAIDGTQKLEASLAVEGENVFSVSATVGTDNDSCQLIDLLIGSGYERTAVYLQSGGETLVVGVNDSYIEISMNDLAEAISEVMSQTSADDSQMAAIAEYLNSSDFSYDLQTVMEVLQTELTKIILVANQTGLVTVADDGTVTIEGNIETLLKIVSTVLQDLSENDEAFSKLASTKIWSMLGLSADGKNEQSMVASIASAVSSVDASTLGGDVSFKCVMKQDGGIEFNMKISTPDVSEEMSIVYDGVSFTETMNIVSEYENESFTVKITDKQVTGDIKIEQNGMTVTGNAVLDLATMNLDGTLTNGEEVIVLEGRLDQPDANTISYKITGVSGGETTVIDIELGLKIIADTEAKKAFEVFVNNSGAEMIKGAFSIENVSGAIEHKSGEAVSKEQLTEMIKSLLGAY